MEATVLKWVCNDCEGKPCVLMVPEGAPEACPFPDDTGTCHTCTWEKGSDRRKVTK